MRVHVRKKGKETLFRLDYENLFDNNVRNAMLVSLNL